MITMTPMSRLDYVYGFRAGPGGRATLPRVTVAVLRAVLAFDYGRNDRKPGDYFTPRYTETPAGWKGAVSQANLAAHFDVSQQLVSMWLAGTRDIPGWVGPALIGLELVRVAPKGDVGTWRHGPLIRRKADLVTADGQSFAVFEVAPATKPKATHNTAKPARSRRTKAKATAKKKRATPARKKAPATKRVKKAKATSRTKAKAKRKPQPRGGRRILKPQPRGGRRILKPQPRSKRAGAGTRKK